jgi:ATP-binding cassette, subfamily G (WHITE), member 2, PDR
LILTKIDSTAQWRQSFVSSSTCEFFIHCFFTTSTTAASTLLAMSSASPWAVVPEAEGFAAKVGESVEEQLARKEHHRLRVDETSGHLVLDDGEKIHTLARRLTEHSIKSNEIGHVNPFNDTDNPLLNPLSEKFSPRAWMKALIGIQSRDPERYPSRVTGVAYKHLSAHGFGEATDYQKVSSFPFDLLFFGL